MQITWEQYFRHWNLASTKALRWVARKIMVWTGKETIRRLIKDEVMGEFCQYDVCSNYGSQKSVFDQGSNDLAYVLKSFPLLLELKVRCIFQKFKLIWIKCRLLIKYTHAHHITIIHIIQIHTKHST